MSSRSFVGYFLGNLDAFKSLLSCAFVCILQLNSTFVLLTWLTSSIWILMTFLLPLLNCGPLICELIWVAFSIVCRQFIFVWIFGVFFLTIFIFFVAWRILHAWLYLWIFFFIVDELHGLAIGRHIVKNLHMAGKQRAMNSLSSSLQDYQDPLYDERELRSIAPTDHKQSFDIRPVIARIVDGSEFDEFKKLYGSVRAFKLLKCTSYSY